MSNKNQLSTLALCKRAGRLLLGFDMMKEAVQQQQAKAVLLAQDLSPKTKKEVLFLCSHTEVPVWQMDFYKQDIQSILRKSSGIVTITDEGFARLFCPSAQPESKGGAMEL